MFPYAMLATTTIFYSNDWPKRVWSFLRRKSYAPVDINKMPILSRHCIYEKITKTDAETDAAKTKRNNQDKKKKNSNFYHKFFSLYTIVYLTLQCFLPYSHFITKVIYF